jgi:acylphosphatase
MPGRRQAPALRGQERFRAIISGTVQMVGFRAFAESRAEMRGITGYVRNLPSGEVEVVAEGDRALLEELLAELRRGPSGARVRNVLVSWEQPRGEFGDFAVRYGLW